MSTELNTNKIHFKAIVILILVIAGVLIIVLNSRSHVEDKRVIVRVTAPLSGPLAYYGSEVQKGFDLAIKNLEPKLKARNVVLDVAYEDNLGQSATAVTALQSFLTDQPAIVLSTNTPLSQPLIPVAEQNQINLLALVVGARDFAKDKQFVFRDAALSFEQGEVLGKYVISKKPGARIATLVVNDDYGLDVVRGVKASLSAEAKVVIEEQFGNKDTDFRTQITKIKSQNPDAVIVVGREQGLVVGVQQLKELGISNEKIFSINAFESPTVFEGLGSAGEGIVFTSTFVDKNSEEGDKFFSDFMELYGLEPGIYAIDAYAAGEYIVESMISCGVSALDINKCLSEKTFDTIKGKISFNEKHDASASIEIYEFRDGHKSLITQ